MPNFLKNFFIKLKRGKKHENHQEHVGWEKKLIKKLGKKEKVNLPSFKQIKYLPSILNKKEKILLLICFVTLTIASIILATNLYLKLPLKPTVGGKYTEGIVGEINLINPLFNLQNEAEQDTIKLIFSGLIKWQDNQLIPDLAERWEEKDGGKKYIFYLKNNVFWHDHKIFNADDIIFSIETIQNKKINSPLRETFLHVKVKKIDDYKVEFVLEKNFSPFLSYLTFGIIPQHLWQDILPENFQTDDLNLSPIGTGPFKFKSITRSETGQIKKVSLTRNKEYYWHPPYLKEIDLKLFNTYEEATEALLTKRIEGLAHYRKTDELKTVPKILNSFKNPLSYHAIIFFEESGILSNKKVRQALVYAIDKEKIKNNLQNIEIINASIIHPQYRHASALKQYKYSKETAEEKIKEAGYVKKGGTWTDQRNNNLKIKFIVSDKLANQTIGEMIKNFWTEIGLTIDLEVLSKDQFSKKLRENDYDAILNTIIEGYDPDPFPLWHSSQKNTGLNFSNLDHIKIDIILEKARLTSNLEERQEYYQEFQEMLAENSPGVFLYQTILSYFQDKKIKGFEASYLPLPTDRFSKIENWYIDLKRNFR